MRLCGQYRTLAERQGKEGIASLAGCGWDSDNDSSVVAGAATMEGLRSM